MAKAEYWIDHIYQGLDKEALEKLSKEKLVELMVEADEYSYNHEGFHVFEDVLPKKYLRYMTKRTKKTPGKYGITMEQFDKAFRDAFKDIPDMINNQTSHFEGIKK